MRQLQWKSLLLVGLCLTIAAPALAAKPTSLDDPAWAKAARGGPLSADQTRALMRELAQFVFENHLKRDPQSPQRGMVYEYFDTRRKGQFDQFVQGEALDTMHDGAWLATAMVNAHRATGDPFYREFLVEWQLPFYLKMLNHSDELFTAKRNDARPGAAPWGKIWAFQDGEKGFVPYYWDDGGSVSMERRRDKNPLAIRPSTDFLAGKPNPHFLLDGYSHGSSNHMAQDLAVMLQQAWLLLKDGRSAASRQLADETAAAAKHLHASRLRHFGTIAMVASAAALANRDAELMKRVPAAHDPRYWNPNGDYFRALYSFKPGQRVVTPGFADNQQFQYYYGIAKAGGKVPKPLAFRLIYDAYTVPLLYEYYSDDAEAPPGVNRFDLHPYFFIDGKPADYRSDRKGPYAGPRPIGSRLGPQNMIVAGWALQLLREYPGIWNERYERDFRDDARVYISPGVAGDEPQRTPRPKNSGGSPRLIPSHPDHVQLRWTELELGGATLRLASTHDALHVAGEADGDLLALKIFSRPDGEGAFAEIAIRDGKLSVANNAGETLLFTGDAQTNDGRVTFSLRLPYTVCKGQKLWTNGVEHGRYSLAVGDARRNLYLASEEADVRAVLERQLGAGLRVWRAIFRQYGYIPTGINAGADWEFYSDSGGYAHLISAAAQWLLYLDGRNDWQVHHVPKIIAE